MTKKIKILICFIVLLSFPLNLPITCHAIDMDSSVNINEKIDSVDKIKKEDIKEEEVIDPSQSFKLIGIYLVSKKPKALIKNEVNKEDGPEEYGVGDFLDEGQTISVTKILFKPTSRVELTDKNGITYLMKPYSLDEEGGGVAKSSTSPKTYPTYSSSKTKSSTYFKSKNKNNGDKKDETTTTPSPANTPDATSQSNTAPTTTTTTTTAATTPQPAPAETTPPPQQSPPPSSSIMAATQDNAAANTPPPSGTSQPSQGASNSAPASSEPNGLDVSRPSNPFGE